MANESDWFEELRTKRQRWVDANKENAFDRGIWNATVEKYADPAHFLFELMQNAEDEGATQAELVISDHAISFEHDGGPFTLDDVDGITGIGNTTKLGEANKIGCFGIGFKSVYVVTERPEVHTRIDGIPFAFAIRDLVVPTRIPFQGRDGWTRFVLPRREASSDVSGRFRAALRDGGPRSMLFLDRLKSLCWTDGAVRERYVVEDRAEGERVLRREDDHGTAGVERYVVLSRAVNREGGGEHAVKVALRRNAEGEIVRTETGTKLAVFFETEEQTGLYFHVHGPFRLTDNRANIKRGDTWNEHLVDEVGRLIVESLPGIRDAGLLRRSFLEILPNGNDALAAPWSRLSPPLVSAFKTHALAPAQLGGHLPASKLMRGPADLRDFLGDDGLQKLSGKPDVRWSVTGLRNSREELFLGSLGIPEWAMTDLIGTLSADPWSGGRKNAWDWFDGLSDEAVQRLYLLLDGAKVSSTSTLVLYVPFIRLENGTRVQVSEALLPQPGDYADGEVDADDLALVKQTLIRGGRGRGKETEEFLLRIGVQVVSEEHYLEAIAKQFYKGPTLSDLTSERHLKHIRRFIAWWKEHKDVKLLAGAAWLRGEGVDGYLAPESIYPRRSLRRHGSRARLWGARYRPQGSSALGRVFPPEARRPDRTHPGGWRADEAGRQGDRDPAQPPPLRGVEAWVQRRPTDEQPSRQGLHDRALGGHAGPQGSERLRSRMAHHVRAADRRPAGPLLSQPSLPDQDQSSRRSPTCWRPRPGCLRVTAR